MPPKSLRKTANALERRGLICNCDLKNWEPERDTSHDQNCRIHKWVKVITQGGSEANDHND